MDNGKRVMVLLLCLGMLLVAFGAGVFLYPYASDFLYRREVAAQKEQFIRLQTRPEETASQPSEPWETIPVETLPFEDLYQDLTAQNERLYEEKQKDLVDPFSYERPGIDLTAYGLPDNVIGFLSIPKMNIELPILLGATSQNMALGAVHLTETSYPIGGNNTNCVLAAHRGYSKAAMFRDIELLEPGDLVYVLNFRENLTYEVVEIRVIAPTDIEACLIQPDRDLLTLLTCHPYGHNYQRYLVFCQRVETE